MGHPKTLCLEIMSLKLPLVRTGLIFCFAAVSLFSVAQAQSADPPPTHAFGQSRVIPGRYIVVYKSDVADADTETNNHMRGVNGRVHHVFGHALKGFAASLPDAAVQALRNHPNVAYVEQDQMGSLTETALQQQQYPATWGLDRVDQVTRPLSGSYVFNYRATGVNAFIIDTGIRADHTEFTGRMAPGYNVIADSSGVVNTANTADCNGHGTHVAGTVGGSTYGVAKGVTLVPVRVLDCTGYGAYSGIIAGINWVAASTRRPAVANMSLAGGVSSAVNAAVAGAVAKGVTMVVAAGNNNASACNYSPASEPSAITVGATDSSDTRASYSNYGSCVDVFAPGSSITSAGYGSTTGTALMSGTSMASPHVAGVAALALAASPGASALAVGNFILANASLNQVVSAGTGSPNRLVYSLAAGGPAEPARQTVAVRSITSSATKSRRSWSATVSVAVRDVTTGAAVANATVNGSFSPGGTRSCVTSTSGSCSLSNTGMALTTLATVFGVTGITGTNMSYDASQNSATQLTIQRP